MKIILASASPRRRELLKQIVTEFEVIPSDAEEFIPNKIPPEIVTELASQKARAVADKTGNAGVETLIIGADTIVVHDGRILGKPRDEADACRMLRGLSGDSHFVYTGVCLLLMREDQVETDAFYERTEVLFYPMTGKEIEAYIKSGDPMDKAGAYGIQSGCGKYIRGIRGDYNNVVGLPVARLYQEMKERGFII
ncbi:MAG: Maf family protein [Lachnospiraceae bacterium]|nr:Maf family protein [Clostridiales bacterium]MCC8142265.1 Maf family protein [Lachnospiraceae bacterium]